MKPSSPKRLRESSSPKTKSSAIADDFEKNGGAAKVEAPPVVMPPEVRALYDAIPADLKLTPMLPSKVAGSRHEDDASNKAFVSANAQLVDALRETERLPPAWLTAGLAFSHILNRQLYRAAGYHSVPQYLEAVAAKTGIQVSKADAYARAKAAETWVSLYHRAKAHPPMLLQHFRALATLKTIEEIETTLALVEKSGAKITGTAIRTSAEGLAVAATSAVASAPDLRARRAFNKLEHPLAVLTKDLSEEELTEFALLVYDAIRAALPPEIVDHRVVVDFPPAADDEAVGQ